MEKGNALKLSTRAGLRASQRPARISSGIRGRTQDLISTPERSKSRVTDPIEQSVQAGYSNPEYAACTAQHHPMVRVHTMSKHKQWRESLETLPTLVLASGIFVLSAAGQTGPQRNAGDTSTTKGTPSPIH